MEYDDLSVTIDELRDRRRSKRMMNFTLRFYTIFGITVTILAIGYFGLTFLTLELSLQQQLALMIAGIGLVLAVMSRVLIIIRREKESDEIALMEEYRSVTEFQSMWDMLEIRIKNALGSADTDVNVYSLRSIITRLLEEEKINTTDVQMIEKALQFRNTLVYGGRSIPSEMITKMTRSLYEIIRKLPPR